MVARERSDPLSPLSHLTSPRGPERPAASTGGFMPEIAARLRLWHRTLVASRARPWGGAVLSLSLHFAFFKHLRRGCLPFLV